MLADIGTTGMTLGRTEPPNYYDWICVKIKPTFSEASKSENDIDLGSGYTRGRHDSRSLRTLQFSARRGHTQEDLKSGVS